MKAAYIEAFGELDDNHIITGELPKPEPREGEVLVRVKAAGVNPVDAAVALGMLKDAIPCSFPLIPGWDAAGVVEQCGHAAKSFAPGDEVYAYARRPELKNGTFAEYISLPEAYLARRPQSLSMEACGGLPLVGLTAWQALFDAGKLKKGQSVLVIGASGGVGSVAIQLAHSVEAHVIGIASEDNHAYMKELGAGATIDYKHPDVPGEVKKALSGDLDLIFDCSRGDVLSKTHTLLKKGGRLVSITNSKPERREDVRFKYVFVEPNAPQLEKLQQLADEGKLTLAVSKTYSLNQAAAALREIQSLHTRGKMVITP